MQQLSYGFRKARKQHRCEGFDQINNGVGWPELQSAGESLPEMPHAIRKGDRHHYQSNADSGSVSTWRACMHCHGLIVKYKLWDQY